MQISVECRGVAQLGSALVSGTRGREFESRRPDQIEKAEEPLVMAVLFLLLNLTAVSRSCGRFLGQILGQTTIFLIFLVFW